MKHSMKMMWGCAAIVVAVVALSLAGANIAYALFALPCVLMMGAMIWMMMRGIGGGTRGSGQSR
jgi:NADH:ubiquinone oxidoreductase subunit 6 (subunit J)